MTKVRILEDDTIYRGEWLTIRAMRRRSGSLPAKEWADGLGKKGTGQLIAASEIMETTLRTNRPPAGRAEKVASSQTGLWELRVTRAGSSPPHLRLLYIRRGQTLWAAHGFTKQKNQLEKKEVDMGDSIVREWMEGDERR
jgi:hypothetical protein